MGVRGLTSYIANHSDCYLMPHELKNCSLVIDGNSLASLLYNWYSNCVCAFGGDYDKYYWCVTNFFMNLKKCGVSPLVVFDGGYEPRKLGTVGKRMRKKFQLAKNITPTSKCKFFPLLMKAVFSDVLRDLNVPFAQCFFEADDEIAAIARKLQCPVLSYDSDFFVYDVMYIPFSTVCIELSKRKNELDENMPPQFYMSCKIYRVENFLNQFGGLDKSMLPLMATLLGNDYISKQIFRNFFSNYLKMPKKRSLSYTQKCIASLLHWLNTETLETATQKVLISLKIKHRRRVFNIIEKSIKGYTQCSSELLEHLGLASTVTGELPVSILTSVNLELTNLAEVYTSNADSCDLFEESNSDDTYGTPLDACDESCSDTTSTTGSIDAESDDGTDLQDQSILGDKLLPRWFKTNFLQGNLPPCFMDMLTLHSYFCSPQVEDFNLPFSHQINLPIIYTIYCILTAESVSEESLIYYGRNSKHNPQKLLLNFEMLNPAPIHVDLLPHLSTLYDIPAEDRKSLLLNTLALNHEDKKVLNTFPEEWKIFLISVVYWARYCKQPTISNCHIHSLLLCLLALNVVDKHLGYHRLKSTFMKHFGSKLVKLQQCRKKKNPKQATKNNKSAISDESKLENVLTTVTEDDCMLVFEKLLPFHKENHRFQENSKLYSVTTVHAFAQFQSSLQHIMYLNSLLNLPFMQCKTAQFYCGTFIQNIYICLKKCADLNIYIESILKCNSTVSLHEIYRLLYETLHSLLPGLSIIKKKRKKGKFRVKISCDDVEKIEFDEDLNANTEQDVNFEDMNNKYSLLGQLDSM